MLTVNSGQPAAARPIRRPPACASRAPLAPPFIPKTEGIKYAGSKLKLLPAILQLLRQTNAKTVLDGFAGTTRVSQALAQCGYRVLCNDIAVWSEVFGTCYLLAKKPPAAYQELIDHLNAVPPQDGWFTEHYGGEENNGCAVQADGLKKPWQKHNTRKLDGMRQEIDKLSLNRVDKAVALTSLMLAMDKVESTLGHYVSYLNRWSPRSYRAVKLAVPNFHVHNNCHAVTRRDIFELTDSLAGAAAANTMPDAVPDVAYFDPPYGSGNEKMPPSRIRYAAYYHIWTSVCLNDRPALSGKARRRADCADTLSASVFEEFRKDSSGRYLAACALEKLIEKTRARWLIISYSSGGRVADEEVQAILSRHGVLRRVVSMPYQKNVMAAMQWTRDWLPSEDRANKEFLFLLEKAN